MSHVHLSDALRRVVSTAARHAIARSDDLRVDDLLAALLAEPLGVAIAPALDPVAAWPPAAAEATAQSDGTLAVYAEERLVRFDRPAERLFSLGANRVILGEYEPRHLAHAVGELAAMSTAPFARFGLDSQAWRQALRANP